MNLLVAPLNALQPRYEGLLERTRLESSSLLERADGRIRHLLEADSHIPWANSYYEYLAYRTLESIVSKNDRGLFDRMMTVFSEPPSVKGLQELFRNTEGEEALQDLMETRRKVLLESGWMVFKLREFDALTAEEPPPEILTGFVDSEGLSKAILELAQTVESSEALSLNERRGRWRERLRRATSIPDLIGHDPKEVSLVLLDEREMDDYLANRFGDSLPPRDLRETLGTHEATPGEKVKIILRNRRRGDLWRSSFELAAIYVHEEPHVLYGNGLVPKMMAFTREAAFRFENGDEGLYQAVLKCSPFGWGLGVRNFVEHHYCRQREATLRNGFDSTRL